MKNKIMIVKIANALEKMRLMATRKNWERLERWCRNKAAGLWIKHKLTYRGLVQDDGYVLFVYSLQKETVPA